VISPYHVGFEVFTAVVMKSIIFWDMTPCSPFSFNRRFGETYRLHLQGLRNRFSKPASKQVVSWRYVPPKRLLKLNGLHAVIFQKMILFTLLCFPTKFFFFFFRNLGCYALFPASLLILRKLYINSRRLSACYFSHPSNSPRFNHPNNIG
jgi:hypothetical protein